MRPILDCLIECVTWTLSSSRWLGLSVTIHGVVLDNLVCVNSALHQAGVGHYGLLGGVVVSEVTHEAGAVADSVEASCVSSLDVPSSSLVNIAVSSDQKTITNVPPPIAIDMEVLNVSDSLATTLQVPTLLHGAVVDKHHG